MKPTPKHGFAPRSRPAGTSGPGVPKPAPKRGRKAKLRNQLQAAPVDPAATAKRQLAGDSEVAASDLRTKELGRFFTVRGVADLLVICDRTVKRWAGKKLPFHKFGGATRFAQHDLCAFIAAARRAGTPLVRPTEDTFYTVEDVVEILNVCVRTVRRRIKERVLVAHDFDGIIRIAASDLRAYCERSRQE